MHEDVCRCMRIYEDVLEQLYEDKSLCMRRINTYSEFVEV